ncbi:MAG: GntR family transcriptional regulator [Marmoricola sp.]
MELSVDASLPDPPFAQIRESVRDQVASGELAPGTRMPTVRRLAGDLGLATNTVARAYRELEALRVIETRGRAGSFVSGDHAGQASREAALVFVKRARALGLGRDEAVELVRRAFGP